MKTIPILGATAIAAAMAPISAQTDFVNYEIAHGHPLEMTPSGSILLCVNTPDSRIEKFDLTSGTPVHAGSVQVGLDAITVRARNNIEAWVVNNTSDSVSIVEIATNKVIDTFNTRDEPTDLVFAAGYAWLTCSDPDLVLRIDPNNVHAPPLEIPILGEDPRSIAVSPTGDQIYVAIHTSGNNTTVLPGDNFPFMQDIVSDPSGPAGGVNPPPNVPGGFNPPMTPGLPTPPQVSLIVRKKQGVWRDDFQGGGRDWTNMVTGGQFDRVAGWDLYDHDIACIDVTQNPPTVSYARGRGQMNINMAIAIRPTSGGSYDITTVGTDATNEIRFEHNLRSSFVRVKLATFNQTPRILGSVDLNPLISSYTATSVPQATRDQSIGDPRAIVWDSTGAFAYVAGMGSNNVIAIDAAGNRLLPSIEVGSGPTGLVIDDARASVYVLNRFGSSISVIDGTFQAVAEIPFHDPTPGQVKRGRKHLYDTHRTSGLGQASCASCHINIRDDGLAWDLGRPGGELRVAHGPNMSSVTGGGVPVNADNYHPMKGPMTTLTLQDLIKGPLHWRGDKNGIREFNSTYIELHGDDTLLSERELDELESFLDSVWIPPNPHRQKSDNGLQTAMDLTPWSFFHHDFVAGTATPLTTGNAELGRVMYNVMCVNCHTPDIGVGPNAGFDIDPLSPTVGTWVSNDWWTPGGVGAHGEIHTALGINSGSTQAPMKPSGFRHTHEKTGFWPERAFSTKGFSALHSGETPPDRVVSIFAPLISPPTYPGGRAGFVADMTAFLMSYAATDMYFSDVPMVLPPRTPGDNSHAATGRQWTLKSSTLSAQDLAEITEMFHARDARPERIEIIVKQNVATGGQRGFIYAGNAIYVDDAGAIVTGAQLINSIGPGTEATFTIVPASTALRAAIDRDADGSFDAIEVSLNTDPASARSVPPSGQACAIPVPTAPTGLGAVAINAYQVNLTWTDTSNNETGFVIERAWTNSPQWEVIADVATNATSYLDGSAGESTGYIYRVRSYNCAGQSTNAVSNATTTPAKPTVEACHVHAVDLQIEVQGTGAATMRRAYGTVNVVNDQGHFVPGAVVTVTITGPSGAGTFSATTTTEAQAFFSTPFVAESSVGAGWTFQVTNISSGTTTVSYDPSKNYDNPDTIK